ncbi:SUMF1/EgtB/PvdO family nonheme iron enzyme [Myxococcota bacterium]
MLKPAERRPKPTCPRKLSNPAKRHSQPGCPSDMVEIPASERRYCIDRWEAAIDILGPEGAQSPWPFNQTVDGLENCIRAVSVAGRKPQGYISGSQAARACAAAGKRLCSEQEWQHACRGPAQTRYPYGNQRRAGLCNDRFRRFTDHPVPRLFQEYAEPGANERVMWSPHWMNDPRLLEFDHTITPSGAWPQCTNELGVYDMVGNLHEWIADPDGTFLGGFFMDTYQNGEGCEYRTRAHAMKYHDYSTGFRCCRDAE